MQPFRHHVFICEQKKPEGVPCCSARGAAETIAAMRGEIARRGLLDDVQITICGSIGLCENGPNMVVYPEGVWYSGVTAADVPELVGSHFVDGKPLERLARKDVDATKAEIRTNRDRYVAAMKARDAAGALPEELEAMFRGFQQSRIALTAIELDVFTAAGSGATAGEIAKTIEADPRATGLLLDALVAMDLLVKSGDRYATTTVTERFLSARGRDDARSALLHQSSLWWRFSHLTECVRTGTASGHEGLTDRDEDWTINFIAAMHHAAATRAKVVATAVGSSEIRRMLDVGGGSGAYSIEFARANPELRAEIVDLETTLPISRGHIDQAGLGDRVTTRAGDILADPFGSDFDLVFVSAICHMFGEAENEDLVARCARALAPGGRLVIQDFILDESGTSPKFAALFSINMLTGTKGGRSYAESEYAEWMTKAGLADVRRIPLPGPTDLIVGVKH